MENLKKNKIMSVKNTQYYIDLENQYGAHNYHPLPVVLDKGEGVVLSCVHTLVVHKAQLIIS